MLATYDFFGAQTNVAEPDKAAMPISRAAFWQVDLVHKKVWWSREAQILHEVDAHYQPSFENAFEFCRPEHREIVKNRLCQAIKQGACWNFEFEVKLKSGVELRLSTEGRPILEEGRVTALLGCFDLVCEAQDTAICSLGSPLQIKSRLQELAELRAVVDETAVFSISDASGKILSVNRNLIRLSGYTEKELIGQGHNLMNSGYHDRAFFAEMWDTISSGEIWRGEICNRSKSGQILWFDTIIYPIPGVNGTPEKFIALRFDVTKKVQSSQLVTEFFEVSNSPNFVLDEDGFLRRVNDAFCASLGQSRSDLMHTPFVNLVSVEDQPRAARAFRRTMKGKPVSTLQLTLRDKNGEARVMQFRATRFENQLFGSAYDVTAQRKRQRALKSARRAAEQASQSKTAFLANMSHEIRTPLNAIVGIADVLAHDELLDDKQKELVRMIYDAGDMLEGLLSDILDLSKVEAGKLSFERAEFSPTTEIQSALRLHMQTAQEKGLQFALSTETRDAELLIGDPLRLRQIISNLASNAVKFTKEGKIICSVQIRPEQGRSIVRFSIEDSGIGFAEKTEAAVFERFNQQRISDTRNYGGSGLGLAISAALAREMGGELQVSSVPGEGTRFDLTLPFDQPVTARAQSLSDLSSGGQLDLKGCRILVAEDSAVNQKVLRLVLEPTGCEITCTANGAEALQTFKSTTPCFDLVLMDMRMPIMDGEEAVREIRSFEMSEQREPTPVLMLSANAMPKNVHDALQAGCNAHVAKPIRRKVLFECIAECLQRGSLNHDINV